MSEFSHKAVLEKFPEAEWDEAADAIIAPTGKARDIAEWLLNQGVDYCSNVYIADYYATKVFRFDKDGNGMISAAEMRHGMLPSFLKSACDGGAPWKVARPPAVSHPSKLGILSDPTSQKSRSRRYDQSNSPLPQ